MSSVLHSLRINSLYKNHGTTYPFTKLIPLLCEERYLTCDYKCSGLDNRNSSSCIRYRPRTFNKKAVAQRGQSDLGKLRAGS